MHQFVSGIDDITLDLFEDVTRGSATAEFSPWLARIRAGDSASIS